MILNKSRQWDTHRRIVWIRMRITDLKSLLIYIVSCDIIYCYAHVNKVKRLPAYRDSPAEPDCSFPSVLPDKILPKPETEQIALNSIYVSSLHKLNVLDMLADKDTAHVAGLVPRRLARHVVGNHLTVYHEILKSDVLDLALLAVAVDHGHLLSGTIVCDIPEGYVLDAASRSETVFPVEEYPDVHQLSLTEVFDPDVFKEDVADEIVISGIYRHASLVVDLFLLMVKNVYVSVDNVLDHIRILDISMDTDHYRMRHIRPENAVLGQDVAA